MMTKILEIAGNMFKEAVRDRLFLIVAVFGVVILGSSFVVAPLSLGEDVRITQDIGLAAISILGLMIAILIGTGIVYREIERRTIYTIVSKPVNRWQFIVGKFLGLNATVGLLLTSMAAVFLVINWITTGGFQSQLMIALLLTWMELILLTALSILMSTLCSPILGAIFSVFLYLIGHTSVDLKELAARFGSQSMRVVADTIYYSLPNLEYLNVRNKVTHGISIDPSYVIFACSYALLYTLVLLTIAVVVFERKEFK